MLSYNEMNEESQINTTQIDKSQTEKQKIKYWHHRKKEFYQDKPSAWWGFRRYIYSGKNSEGNRFITNKDL